MCIKCLQKEKKNKKTRAVEVVEPLVVVGPLMEVEPSEKEKALPQHQSWPHKVK